MDYSDGYYDHHPVRVPQIPIALIGFFGSGHDRVGIQMASLTGLPYVEIDRSVEHVVGQSVGQLVLENGEPRYREEERQSVARALDQRPPGIVVLGEGALADSASSALVAEKSVLVYLYRDVAELSTRLRDQHQRSPGTAFPWFPATGFCDNDFEQLHESRMERYEEAALRVNASGRRSDDVAAEIVRLLELG